MDNESHSSFPYSREKTKKLTTAAMTTYKKPIRTVILAARAENDSDTEPLRKPPLGKQHLEESNDPEIWWTNCFSWCQAHPAPPGYVWTPVKTWINYPWNRAGVQPSTMNQAVVYQCILTKLIYWVDDITFESTSIFKSPKPDQHRNHHHLSSWMSEATTVSYVSFLIRIRSHSNPAKHMQLLFHPLSPDWHQSSRGACDVNLTQRPNKATSISKQRRNPPRSIAIKRHKKRFGWHPGELKEFRVCFEDFTEKMKDLYSFHLPELLGVTEMKNPPLASCRCFYWFSMALYAGLEFEWDIPHYWLMYLQRMPFKQDMSSSAKCHTVL